MKDKSLVSITDFDKNEYLKILEIAADFEKNPNQKLLNSSVVASLFFEPSTRTRLKFRNSSQQAGCPRYRV